MSKTPEVRSRWYLRNDVRDYDIYERIVRTHSKNRALQYYDGTTQYSYQWPKKGWETVYCRREPTPFECAYRWLDFNAELHELDLEDDSKSSFRYEVAKNQDGKEETKLFATKHIPAGSYIMPTHLASSLEVTTRNIEGLENNVKVGGGKVAVIEDLLGFFDTYMHESTSEGIKLNYVEIGGTCLMRRVNDDEEANVRPWLPPHPSGRRPKFSPVYERHRVAFDVFLVASRDIVVGEELTVHKNAWKRHKDLETTTKVTATA